MRVQHDFYAEEFHKVHDAARGAANYPRGQLYRNRDRYLDLLFAKVETEFDEYDSEERIYRRSLRSAV